MKAPSDRTATLRVAVAFFFLIVFIVALSVGAYFLADLKKQQESAAVRESQSALRGMVDAHQLDQALQRNPSNKILQAIAFAAKAAAETGVAAEALSAELQPASLAKSIDWGSATRSDLEALGRDLKTAEANAAALMARYVALLKIERDRVEKYILSLHLEKETVGRFLEQLDRQHAKMTEVTSNLYAARAEFYRAYGSYVAVMVGEFGSYKVVDGQFIFAFQRTVDRYNVAAHAMTVASRHVAEQEEVRKNLTQSPKQGWEQLVGGE